MYSASTVQPVSYQNSLSVSPVAEATHTICTRTALAAAAVDRLGILVCSLNVTTPMLFRSVTKIDIKVKVTTLIGQKSNF